MKAWISVVVCLAVLAGCSSGVKLDSVPVEDKTAKSVSTSSSAASDASKAGAGSLSNAPQPVTQPAVAPVNVAKAVTQPVAVPTVSRLVYFDYDSFAIKPEFQSLLDTHARYLRAEKAKRIAIEGHTDERGGREYNLALGQKRAEAVRNALVLLGVSESQMEAVSFGKEKPAVSGADEAALAKNRRAELMYR